MKLKEKSAVQGENSDCYDQLDVPHHAKIQIEHKISHAVSQTYTRYIFVCVCV